MFDRLVNPSAFPGAAFLGAAFALAAPGAAEAGAYDEQASSPAKIFDGPYLAVELGRQNVIAGALLGGVDTLAQDSQLAVSFSGGFRKQFAGGFVLGAEGGVGVLHGDLDLIDPSGAIIDYNTNSQTHYGLIAGHTVGPKNDLLVFGYVSQVNREFEVTIVTPGAGGAPDAIVQQTDGQGLLRYGAGIEKQITGALHARASIGASRADFGDRLTNFDPRTKVDLAIGLVLQF